MTFRVYLEGVIGLDLFGLRVLDEDPLARFADGQRLEGSGQLPIGDRRLVLDLLVRHCLSHVEQEQQTHLKQINQKVTLIILGTNSKLSWNG